MKQNHELIAIEGGKFIVLAARFLEDDEHDGGTVDMPFSLFSIVECF